MDKQTKGMVIVVSIAAAGGVAYLIYKMLSGNAAKNTALNNPYNPLGTSPYGTTAGSSATTTGAIASTLAAAAAKLLQKKPVDSSTNTTQSALDKYMSDNPQNAWMLGNGSNPYYGGYTPIVSVMPDPSMFVLPSTPTVLPTTMPSWYTNSGYGFTGNQSAAAHLVVGKRQW